MPLTYIEECYKKQCYEMHCIYCKTIAKEISHPGTPEPLSENLNEVFFSVIGSRNKLVFPEYLIYFCLVDIEKHIVILLPLCYGLSSVIPPSPGTICRSLNSQYLRM